MAVQDAGDVVTVVYAYELAAERISVAVFEEYLLADVVLPPAEIHRHILSVEGQARKRHALCRAVGRHAYRRRVGDDLRRIVEGLLGIPELYAAHLRCRLHGKERLCGVGDDEERPDGSITLGMLRAAPRRPVHAYQRDVLPQNDARRNGITLVRGLDKERRPRPCGPVYGTLQVLGILLRGVFGQYAEVADTAHGLRLRPRLHKGRRQQHHKDKQGSFHGSMVFG